jgi:ankyrin repeat protein
MFEHVRLLLDKGARPNARDEDGWTPLHFACQAGSSDIVLLLLNHGAHPTVTNSIEQTALHVAASNGRKEVVTVLLDSAEGSKLVGMLDGNGATPLLWAASAGCLGFVFAKGC